MTTVNSRIQFRLRPARIAMAAFLILGCSRWQNRADDLQHSLDVFVQQGGRLKTDFVRRFGAPASCKPIDVGELCRWNFRKGQMRVGFDKAGNFTGGAGVVRRDGRTYHGKDEEALDDSEGESCQYGEIMQDGQCNPAPATAYPESHSAQEDTTGGKVLDSRSP